MSRFNRTNFIKTEVIDDIVRLHLVNDYFDDCFKITREVQYYQVERTDIQNPDLLSLKVYGVSDYWWILCMVNRIYDVWNDLIEGDIIIVPDISDIEDFYTNVKKKQRNESK
jgi:hypothetical protein